MTLYQGATEPTALHYMARGSIVQRLANTLAHEYGWEDSPDDFAQAVENAEMAVDSLIGDAVLFPSDRWDEECHVCEQRIGDHRVDGRCPG